MATQTERVGYSRDARSAADLRFGVIGHGYWGPNVARNINKLESCYLSAICDKNPASLRGAREAYPNADLTTDPSEILNSTDIDVVAVVTPVWTHFELAKRALQNGKHVFVEKPFTATADQAEQLIELATRNNLKIVVDHTFLFTGAVKKIRQLVDDGTLGDLYYYDSTRVNLGLFQHDINVAWDLAPHDLSIMDHVISKKPEAIVATGEKHLNGHVDMAFITIYFPGSVIAHINVNWMSPVKVRTTLIGGEKRMLVWNDLEADEKIKVYDKGVQMSTDSIYELLVSYRSGDMWAPRVEQTEALKAEIADFVDCIVNDRTPINDGKAGWRIVKMLEAVDQSLAERGKIVPL
jgi:predicted dehydrogenase